MARECILVVEDEEDILELIRYTLAKEGYRVTPATSGEQALKTLKGTVPDLIVLDLMLPEIDGLEVCRRVKSDPHTQHVPIVMLTAKGDEADVVAGLELGADDYIAKPFSPRVLVARIRAVLRRKARGEAGEKEVIAIGDLVIDPGRHEVSVGGKAVDLTFMEFRLLHVLMRRPGWVFTRCQIVDAIRGPDYPVTERAVDVQIAALRRKLGEAGQSIKTVRGVGYKFQE